MARNYKEEYRKHHASDEAKEDRAQRNRARDDKEKELGRELRTDEHVDHIGGINNHGGGTAVISAKENMSKKDPDKDGGKGSRERGSRRKRALVSALRRS